MAGLRPPAPLSVAVMGDINDGTLVISRSPMPGPIAKSIAAMSTTERIGEALRRSVKYIPGEAGGRVMALLEAKTLVIIGAVLVAWAGSHALGIGEVADVIMLVGGVIFLGRDAFEAGEDLGRFVYKALNGKTEDDLEVAGKNFAHAVAIIGVDAAIAFLTHQSIKVVKGRYRPTVTGDPSLPPGQGATNKFGDVTYSTAGTTADQQLALFHERVHSFFSPKLQPLRNFRADLGMQAYMRSSLLQYLEEALAESYAQMRVNGIKALPVGLKFPIANGYVTLSAVLVEAGVLVGTIVIGGITYYVYVAIDQK